MHGYIYFYNDQIQWRDEGISQLQDEIRCLKHEQFVVCDSLLRKYYVLSWSLQLLKQHDYEKGRYTSEIGHLCDEISHFEADKLFFTHEISVLKILSGVDDPLPRG